MLNKLILVKIKVLLIAVLVVIFTIDASAFEADEWKVDLEYLQKTLPKVHKNLFFNITQKEFEEKLTRLQGEVDNLKDLDIVLRLMEVFSSIGDAHTGMSLRNSVSKYYPIFYKKFGDSFYVVSISKDYEELIGSKLISINNQSVDDIVKKLTKVIISENRADLLYQVQNYLNVTEILKYCGIIDSKNKYVLQTDEGLMTYTPEELDFSQYDQRNFVSSKFKQSKYQNNEKQIFWYEYYEEDDILYFQYNRCWSRELEKKYRGKADSSLPSFDKISKEIINFLKKNNINKFVIDLRNNSGGSSLQGTQFAKKIKELDLDTDIYVIIGNRTFSSAIINAIDFKEYCNATLIGEPTRGKPNHYGEVKKFALPNTKINISYSTKYFTIYDKDTDSLYPDIKVIQTYSDFINGIDVVMESIRKM